MMSEIRKSIYATLYERSTSPLWGTFIISWLVWNWKIPYVTFFVSEKVVSDKIKFIVEHHSNWIDMIGAPAASTAIIIGLVPLLSNGAYWLTLEYQQWRTNKKREYEKDRLLTIEESTAILNDMALAEEKFVKTINKKDNDIMSYHQRLEGLQSTLNRIDHEARTLKIHKAYYGTGTNKREVTQRLQQQIIDNKIIGTVNNEFIGVDPAPGEQKTLEIIFSKQGMVNILTYVEGSPIEI